MTDSSVFNPLDHSNRINIGCGWDHRDDYLNIDFLEVHNPDLVADVRNLSMLPANHYVEVVAQDVLEHLERAEVDPALVEWARLLKVGGQLVLRVPDVMGVARLIAKEATVEHHRTMLHALLGTQAYDGDYHHATFTELTLRRSLYDAGFEITDLRPRDEWMMDCIATRRDDLGDFDPGPLPLLRLEQVVPVAVDTTPTEESASDLTDPPAAANVLAGRIGSAAAALAERIPGSAKDRARSVLRSGRDAFRDTRNR